MRTLAALFFAVSAFAYQVTYPTDTQGWTTSGPNVLSWVRVDTDPTTFAAVLKNDQNSSYVEVLNTNVDGTSGSITCNEPSGGWPTGSDFRVNLAQDAQHLDSLLAQSPQFDITGSGSGGSSGSSGSTSASGSTTSSGFTTSTSSSTGTSSRSPTSTLSGGSSTSSDTSTTPTSSSAAFLTADARVGLLTTVAVLTALITTLF